MDTRENLRNRARLAAYERWSHAGNRQTAEKAAAEVRVIRLTRQAQGARRCAEETRQKISWLRELIQALRQIADEQDRYAELAEAELAEFPDTIPDTAQGNGKLR